MRALILATYPTQRPGPPVPFDITLKLSLTNPDLSNAHDEELLIRSMACIRSPSQKYTFGAATISAYDIPYNSGYDSLAYLLGFGPQHSIAGFQRHTLRGVLPEGDMGRRNLFDVEIQTEDSVSLITRRIATLSAKRSDRTSDNRPIKIPGQAPRLHVLTWSVITTPVTEEVPASQLGS
jgi:hypothetical protein